MRALILVVALVAIVAPTRAAAQTPELDAAANRELVQITGDLYRFRSGNLHSVLLVTREGILVVDPLGIYAASWLAKELQARFPGTPVRYVVLTHHHAERAGGAGLLKPQTLVGHQDFRSALDDSSTRGGTRYVIVPQTTFADRHTIDLGGHHIELIHTGPFHSRDSIAVVFTNDKMAFVGDAPPVRTEPFAFGAMRPGDVVRWLTAVASADVDTVMFGDGTTMPHEAIKGLAQYLGQMREAVLAGYDRGHSLNKALASVRLADHSTSPHYAGRERQIRDMYRQITFFRADIIVSGVANYLPERDPKFCEGYDHCNAGGAVAGGTIGALLSFGRRFGVQVEATGSDQFWSSRTRPSYEEETVFRPLLVSGLIRFNVTRSRNLSLLAGATRIGGSVDGLDRVSGIFTPQGGRHRIDGTDTRMGFTGGIELSHRLGALRLVVPLRATYFTAAVPPWWPSRLQASAGLGLAIPLARVIE